MAANTPKLSQFETKKLNDMEKLQSSRDFTNGLKIANKILKKRNTCAEALAWKSYFTYMKKQTDANKEVALNMIKDALRLCKMQSALVWKVNGMIYKEMQDFPNALKCSSVSLKQNSEDISLLNEIATLNLYSKNYKEFMNNTRIIFKKNPNTFSIARYIFALALNKYFDAAIQTGEMFQQGWRTTSNEDELLLRSEFCLFQCIIYLRNGKYQECLDFIEKADVYIRDRELLLENKIECLKHLNEKNENNDKIHSLINELLKIYPENGDYFDILESLLYPDKNDTESLEKYIEELFSIKDSLKSRYAHVRILELIDINDTRFKPLLIDQIWPLLAKGAPSIFFTINELSDEKLRIALSYTLDLLERSKNSNKADNNNGKNEGILPITSVPIAHLFAAHLIDRIDHDYKKALEHIDAGIKHTPTCIELINWKTRLLYRNGRIHEALKYAHELREADPNDRNANLLLVKVLFLAGRRKEAEYEATLFSGEEFGKPLIYETQFNAYYLLSGFSAIRSEDFEFAVKRMYRGILSHFEEYRKNEFNYLGWSWRRPRVLFEMIETLNTIENNEYMGKAIEKILTLSIKDLKHKNVNDANNANDLKEIKEVAKRALVGLFPRALYMACIVFAENNNVLLALRCYLKLAGTEFIFAATPSMQKMIKLEEEKNLWKPVIKEIIKEEYHECKDTPKTFNEIFYQAKGFWALGNEKIDESIALLKEALEKFNLSFKKALEVYVFCANESGNEKMKTEISNLLKGKYPEYEFDPEGEPDDYVPGKKQDQD